MPIELSYENGAAGVVLTGSGVVTGLEVHRCNDDLNDSGRIERLRYQLWDFCRVSRLDLNSSDMRRLVEQDKSVAALNPDLVVAIVGDQELMLSLAKMWDAFVSEAALKANVFRTVAEGRAWIEQHAGARPPQRAPRADATSTRDQSVD